MFKIIKIIKREEKLFWLLAFFIYGVPNILTFLGSLNSQKILVDEKDIWLTSSSFDLINCIIGVVFSLVFLSFYLSRCVDKFFPLKNQREVFPRMVGVLVFALQALDAVALFSSDYGRVGGSSTSSSFIAIAVSYLNPGAIFLVYYGHAREKKFPYLNFLIFILITMARGWSGFWLILFFIEFYYWAKYLPLKRTIFRSVMVVFVGLAIYPVTQAIKVEVRGAVLVESKDFYSSMNSLLNRLQFYSNVVLLSQESRSLKADIDGNRILPFYADNQIAEKVMTILGINFRPPSLQKIITIQYLIDIKNIPMLSVLEDFSWYSTVGIAGWFFVLSWIYIPLFIIFVLFIAAFPYWFAGRFIGARSIIPVLHAISLVYLYNGWFSPQIGFTIGLIIYSYIFHIGRGRLSLKNKRNR